MPLITWNDTYKTSIASIDEQHKKLVGIINDLHDAMSKGQGREALTKTLNGLIEYTRIHFKYEEKLMVTHNYVGYAKHKAEHDELIQKVLDLQHMYQTQSLGLTVPIMNFLKDWLTNHIARSDKMYAPYLKSKGVV
jgi:hemerythrin